MLLYFVFLCVSVFCVSVFCGPETSSHHIFFVSLFFCVLVSLCEEKVSYPYLSLCFFLTLFLRFSVCLSLCGLCLHFFLICLFIFPYVSDLRLRLRLCLFNCVSLWFISPLSVLFMSVCVSTYSSLSVSSSPHF